MTFGRATMAAIAHLKRPAIDNLFEAYDDASDALEQMEVLVDPDEGLLEEYRQICREIETEIFEICRHGNYGLLRRCLRTPYKP